MSLFNVQFSSLLWWIFPIMFQNLEYLAWKLQNMQLCKLLTKYRSTDHWLVPKYSEHKLAICSVLLTWPTYLKNYLLKLSKNALNSLVILVKTPQNYDFMFSTKFGTLVQYFGTPNIPNWWFPLLLNFVALCIVIIVVSLIKRVASNENIECFREYFAIGYRAPVPNFL
jgi:hypothetical protein